MNFSDHPNESAFTLDDQEARTFLAKEGLLEKLEQPGAEKRFLPNQVRFLIVRTHPTHWIQAIRFFGFKTLKENGYIIRCFAKSEVTREQFEKQMEIEKKDLFRNGAVELSDDLPPAGTN